MHTTLLMTETAITLAIAGVLRTFIPEDILHLSSLGSNKSFHIIRQMLGASYFASAMLNGVTRTNLIGDNYGRPTAIANSTHLFVGGMALTKGAMSSSGLPSGMLAGTYSIFAVSFGIILFRHPKGSV